MEPEKIGLNLLQLGFDPIFYMHHANVDRLLALWSALNPDIWVTRGKQYDGGSYTIKNEAYVDSNTGEYISIPT